MQALVIRRLAEGGLYHYEISNFARPGHEALHNTLYWRGAEYLGLGVSAASHLVLEDGRAVRYTRKKQIDHDVRPGPPVPAADPEAVIRALRADDGLGELEVLDPEARRREAVFLGLRLLARGLDRVAFVREHHVDPRRAFATEIATLIGRGLLQVRGRRLRLTARGARFADEAGSAFL
jgi:oxygen-independent coproporphyrinogen-3 oxidase